MGQAAVQIVGVLMSAEDHFMRMVFDSMPNLHKILVTTCVKSMEEVKKIEGSIDSRDVEETAESE